MALDFNNAGKGIDPTTADAVALLTDLQCNILKSHGRDHTVHLFVRFTAPSGQARQVMSVLAADYITSALTQHQQSKAWTGQGQPGGLVGSILLSATGYAALGFDPDGFASSDQGGDFRAGMKRQGPDIIGRLLDTANKDPHPNQWEAGYQGEVHAMILLADDDTARLDQAEQDVSSRLAPVATILQVEQGHVLRNQQPKAEGKAEPERKGQPIEHFGYVDGRSNPLFFQDDIEKERAGGTDEWDPSAPLNLVLVPDPFGGPSSQGSYFVFRKLEQNVEGFNLGVLDLASKLGLDPDLAGAMAVGRFKDGTPLTLQGHDGLGDVNNFNYAREDRAGSRCPVHAHIRKVNPRGTTPFTSSQSERSRRIVRRGIPYGERDLSAPPPRDGVGLLFMCYQANINHQFEFVQRTWADNPNFPRNLILPDTGDDPIIGQDVDANAAQEWPPAWDSDERKRRNFGGYVTLKGGEYFFAPSLSCFAALARA